MRIDYMEVCWPDHAGMGTDLVYYSGRGRLGHQFTMGEELKDGAFGFVVSMFIQTAE